MSGAAAKTAIVTTSLAYLAVVMVAVVGGTLYRVTTFINAKRRIDWVKESATAARHIADRARAAAKKKFSLRGMLTSMWGAAKEEMGTLAEKNTRTKREFPAAETSILAVVAIVLVMVGVGTAIGTAVLFLQPRYYEPKTDADRRVHDYLLSALVLQTAAQLVLQAGIAVVYEDYDEYQADDVSQRSDVAHAVAAFAVYVAAAGLLTKALEEIRNDSAAA